MPEDANVEGQVDNSTQDDVGLSDLELFAQERGWRPGGEKTAEEWLSFGLQEGKDLRKEVKSMKGQINSLSSNMRSYEEMAKSSIDGQVEDLEAKLKAAASDPNIDMDQVREINDRIVQLRVDQKMKTNRQGPEPSDPTWDAWVTRNPWYLNDPYLKQQADLYRSAYDTSYGGQGNPDHYEHMLEYVERTMKPHLVEAGVLPATNAPLSNPNSRKPQKATPKVADYGTGSSDGNAQNVNTIASLPPPVQPVAREWLKVLRQNGVNMSEEEYVKVFRRQQAERAMI